MGKEEEKNTFLLLDLIYLNMNYSRLSKILGLMSEF